jgi:putative membrane protein
LWAALIVYAQGRICQQFPDLIPVPLIVLLQVAPPAVFALVHGSILYGVRGMTAFTAFCLSAGALCESLSLRTGFPFGHYSFTGLMGPQVLHLPILLVLAYLGIGYCSWVLALLILHYRDRALNGAGVVAVPLLASTIMLAWDLSMEAIWSTIDHAWIWRDGGRFYGVPVSNFLGWFFTACLFYQAFALYCRRNSIAPAPASRGRWRAAIVCYGVCAVGNLLIFREGLFPHAVVDATGRQWMTMDILVACVMVSLFAMTPAALIAWHRLEVHEACFAED